MRPSKVWAVIVAGACGACGGGAFDPRVDDDDEARAARQRGAATAVDPEPSPARDVAPERR